MSRAEWWSFWSGIAALTLGTLAAVAAGLAWYWSKEVGEETTARTQLLELQSLEQRERTAIAERSLADAQLELSKRQEQNPVEARTLAEVRERAAIAELKLLESEERDRPRRLNTEAMAAFLIDNPVKVPDLLTYVSGSTNEPLLLAKQISEALRLGAVGIADATVWVPPRPHGALKGIVIPIGVAVVARSTGAQVEQARILQRALVAGGIEADILPPPPYDQNFANAQGFDGSFPPLAVMIRVGLKQP